MTSKKAGTTTETVQELLRVMNEGGCTGLRIVSSDQTTIELQVPVPLRPSLERVLTKEPDFPGDQPTDDSDLEEEETSRGRARRVRESMKDLDRELFGENEG